MKVERTASPSLVDASLVSVAPKRVRPSAKHPFTPISECESRMFAALKVQESLAEAQDKANGRKSRLPRFSLMRGEVALLAERVWDFTRRAT